ncbi:MAG: alpha/beta hydrolase [Proteobacteria bacterium]|nr:alpha/beta hydrolase [Pseudomonadota bacterium]
MSVSFDPTHAEWACNLSPATNDVLRRMARAGHPALHTLAPAQARAFYERAAGVLELPSLDLGRDETWHIPTRDGAMIRARLWAPSHARHPVLLYFHGGGFTIGSSQTHAGVCQQLAALADCAVLSVDYRLAPEHRFPVAVHDAWDALAWLLEHGAARGLDTARVAVGGDSAGGTLAAVTALHARDHGWPVALQLLFYPGTTGHQDTDSHQRFAHALVLGKLHCDYFFSQYIEPSQRSDWRFAPLHAAQHEGVAALWLGLAEHDPLHDEGLAYADALRLARVPVALEIYPGTVHGFIQWGRAEPLARQAHQDAAAALRAAWQGAT